MASVVSTAVLGLIGVYIAYQQYHVNRTKLQMDLYDRRFKVYLDTLEFFGEVQRNCCVSREALISFSRACDESAFLFGPKMESYLETLRTRAVDLNLTKVQLDDQGLGIGEQRSQLSGTHTKLLLWFNNEFKEARKRFADYMTVRGI